MSFKETFHLAINLYKDGKLELKSFFNLFRALGVLVTCPVYTQVNIQSPCQQTLFRGGTDFCPCSAEERTEYSRHFNNSPRERNWKEEKQSVNWTLKNQSIEQISNWAFSFILSRESGFRDKGIRLNSWWAVRTFVALSCCIWSHQHPLSTYCVLD